MTPENRKTEPGWLALVSSPIGNLEDITLRALRTLKEADLVAAEDTRRSARLLNHYDIDVRTTSYHVRNEHRKTAHLVQCVEDGTKVAVLSDAGTPLISDPGFLLVREALQRGIEPVIVPGASSVTYAVTAAGLPADTFCFYGFAPPKAGKRRRFLHDLAARGGTAFLFESPYRIEKLLGAICEVIGPQTPLALIREATKLHEERLRGTAAALLHAHTGRTWKGEIVVGLNLRDTADSSRSDDSSC